MKTSKQPQSVLSLYSTKRGLGFCLFDTPQNLIDWGYSDIRWNKRIRSIQKLKSLIDLYQPEVLVLEDTEADSCRRSRRIKKLTKALTKAAIGWQLPVYHCSSEQVNEAFDVKSKDARAACIAKVLPELNPYLPTKCNFWESQHPQMQMFDAVSLALTYFYLET
jgi:hypothetical protein